MVGAFGTRRSATAVLVGMGLLLVSPAGVRGGGTPELVVGGGSGRPGDTVAVSIQLSNDPAQTAVSADLDIAFPTALLDFTGPVTEQCTLAARLDTTHQVGGTVPQPGLLRLAFFARELEILPLGDGELATCAFRIRPDADEVAAALTVVLAQLGDARGQLLPVTATGGAITISDAPPEPTPTAPPRCPADCDGNGTVTVDELIRSINIALGNLPASECAAADDDGDGTVVIAEVIRGVAGVLGACGG